MKPAKIEYGGIKTPCTIHDLSETGAALDISELNGKILGCRHEKRSSVASIRQWSLALLFFLF